MIVWVEKALVLVVHDRQVAEHGGSARGEAHEPRKRYRTRAR